eukprot:gene9329-biopygen1667
MARAGDPPEAKKAGTYRTRAGRGARNSLRGGWGAVTGRGQCRFSQISRVPPASPPVSSQVETIDPAACRGARGVYLLGTKNQWSVAFNYSSTKYIPVKPLEL